MQSLHRKGSPLALRSRMVSLEQGRDRKGDRRGIVNPKGSTKRHACLPSLTNEQHAKLPFITTPKTFPLLLRSHFAQFSSCVIDRALSSVIKHYSQHNILFLPCRIFRTNLVNLPIATTDVSRCPHFLSIIPDNTLDPLTRDCSLLVREESASER